MARFNIIQKIIAKLYFRFAEAIPRAQKISYSQCGEDLIVDFLLTHILEIKNPNYLDIGAHHPVHFSNTYLFYQRGCRGVSLEPDPVLFKVIAQERSGDININKGVGFKEQSEMADFYTMSYRALNTFSKIDAERISESGVYKIDAIQSIELININTIMSAYFPSGLVDFLSIDVEGLDLDILKSIDFIQYKPRVICVETIVFTSGKKISKLHDTIDFLVANGYHNYADTSINTIFVRKDLL